MSEDRGAKGGPTSGPEGAGGDAKAAQKPPEPADAGGAPAAGGAPEHDVEQLAATAMQAVQSALGELDGDAKAQGATAGAAKGAKAGPAGRGEPSPLDLPSFKASVPGAKNDIALISDVTLQVTIELGRTRMSIEDVLQLGDGSVVELDKLAGDPVDIFVNGRQVARGEVLVLNENFCVRVSEVLEADDQTVGSRARTGGG